MPAKLLSSTMSVYASHGGLCMQLQFLYLGVKTEEAQKKYSVLRVLVAYLLNIFVEQN